MYSDEIEEKELFGQGKSNQEDRAKHVFNSLGSAGANNQRLAQLLTAWDFAMSLLKWDASLTKIITGYQASVDAKYHDDYKAIATIEELDKRLAMRKIQSQQGQSPSLM